MTFLTLNDIQKPQRILMRVDLNLPFHEGKVMDDTRFKVILPTLTTLQHQQARIILISHLGRPKGQVIPSLSLEPVANYIRETFKLPISFHPTCVGEEALEATHRLPKGEILLLENLRFHPEEEANETDFAKNLSQQGNLYINEAFSVSHRDHASVVGLPRFLPSYAGLHFCQEIKALESICKTPKRPVLAIVGGAKISTKLQLLDSLLDKVDSLAIIGAMAHPFLVAQGFSVGKSFSEEAGIEQAAMFLEKSKKHDCTLLLPLDGIIESEASISPKQSVSITHIQPDQRIVDIGPQTLKQLEIQINSAQTVLWNGPAGLFEVPPYDQGTQILAHLLGKASQEHNLISIAGGGDTAAALQQGGCFDQLTYVSTAGGAFLEWLEGKSLPGIKALEKS